jgi:hypothetical protein
LHGNQELKEGEEHKPLQTYFCVWHCCGTKTANLPVQIREKLCCGELVIVYLTELKRPNKRWEREDHIKGKEAMSAEHWNPRVGGLWTQRHAWALHARSAGAAVNLVLFGCCRATGASSLLEPKSQE